MTSPFPFFLILPCLVPITSPQSDSRDSQARKRRRSPSRGYLGSQSQSQSGSGPLDASSPAPGEGGTSNSQQEINPLNAATPGSQPRSSPPPSSLPPSSPPGGAFSDLADDAQSTRDEDGIEERNVLDEELDARRMGDGYQDDGDDDGEDLFGDGMEA